MNKERNLIYIPVIHTRADMGSVLGTFHEEFLEKHGKKEWKKHIDEIEEMWLGLKKRIRQLELDCRKVRIYQDSLPVCGKEVQMVKDLANKGSKNHELINWLIGEGCTLEGSEDIQLLLKEYNYIQKIVYAETEQKREQWIIDYEKQADELMACRDDFIKKRIDATLKEGEIALLFMGLMHKVDEGLADDIYVTYLIHRLPFKRQFEVREA